MRAGIRAIAFSAVVAGPFHYSAAPVGTLRWEPPSLVPESRSVDGAVPVSCPQIEGDGLPGQVPEVSEDCLQVKVWAPENAKKAPVIVFFHGGGLRSGSGFRAPYDGSGFAGAGAVFVSFNYRLGPFGWLSKEGEAISRGLQDQVAALRWVRRRIESYGGDPANVTLLGHSMGAFSIRQLVNAGLAPEGVRQVVLFSSGSFFGKAPNHALPARKFAEVSPLPWKVALERFRGERLSFLPSGPLHASRWKGIRVLQTVLQDEYEGEPDARARFRERICEAAQLAGGLEGSTEAWVYLLHGFGQKHGSELLALFSGDPEGKRLRSLVLGFAARGELPRSWWLLPAEPFRASAPRALHLYTWAQIPRTLGECH